MAVDDEELYALRKRAYGPDADIQLDARAVNRLRELEAKVTAHMVAAPVDEDVASAARSTPIVPVNDLPPSNRDLPMPDRDLSSRIDEWIFRLSGVRRSTILVGVAVIVVAAVLITALVVVQRVQTDPLRIGATQVARLQTTSDYPIPVSFGGNGFGSSAGVQAYQEFYGLRSVISTKGGFFRTDSKGVCLTVYSTQAISVLQSGSDSGPLLGGCSAGKFPAEAQFAASTEGLPASLQAKYGKAASFQFVYDSVNNEVVVFVDR